MNHTEHNQHPDQTRQLQPAIWVASLADYTNGRLHGQWLHANQDPDALHAAVHDMLACSPTPDIDEMTQRPYRRPRHKQHHRSG